ncbi:MAG: bestrophin family protein [Janthinobacterium lividum]
MVVQQNSSFRSLIAYIGWSLGMLLLWDLVVTFGYVTLNENEGLEFPSLPVTLAGSALVLFLSLRNNAAYARWWEARTLWGAIVNSSRSFARQANSMIGAGENDQATHALRHDLVIRQINYANALRFHLLKQRPANLLEELADAERMRLTDHANIPNAILMRNAQDLAQACRAGSLGAYERVLIEQTLKDLSNAQGGLERICNTPLPKQYAQYPRIFVNTFCVLLPLGLVDSLLLYTPIASTLVGFMLMTMEKMGRDLQDPFNDNVHNVPMESICQTIRIDLLQGIGKKAPTPIASVDGVLW